jgi:hypothetical protein
MYVTEEGEAFMIGARGLQEFLERRLAGEDIEVYRFGIGVGPPADSPIFADVTDISEHSAQTLLEKLAVQKAA